MHMCIASRAISAKVKSPDVRSDGTERQPVSPGLGWLNVYMQ